MLAMAIAKQIDSSGCNIEECILVLAVHIAGLIGMHAPNIDEVERCCAKTSHTIVVCARDFHEESDIRESN